VRRDLGDGYVTWFLHTADAHDLYRKFGFDTPDDRALERWSRA
jgi:hypothetical protein